MNKQIKIPETEARFPLDKLTLSPMNPRQNVPEQDIIEFAESIWTAGLIQNMAGLADKHDGAEVTAGGRRLRALKYLATQHPDMANIRPDLANPMITLAPNRDTAQTWANMENIARRDLHPAEEIRAYGKMEAQGSSPAAIARVFAVTEKHVYRRLTLAHLAEPIINALAGGEINLGMAACFTICDDEKHSLAVLERVRGDAWSDHQLKKLLKPDSIKGSDRRAIFVGEDVYKQAGGKLGGDLFADEKLFDDPEILEDCFQRALEDAASELADTEGWKWVETTSECYFSSYSLGLEKYGRVYPVEGVLDEKQSERYDALAELAEGDVLDEAGEVELADLKLIIDGDYTDPQKAIAGAYVYVDTRGLLQRVAGFVKPEDTKAAIEAGVLTKVSNNTNGDQPKSPISAKLADDLGRIVTGVRQQAILHDPDLLLDLLAYQLSHDLCWCKPFGISTTNVPNWPTTEAEGYVLDTRLTAECRGDMYGKDLAKSFRAFRRKGADHMRGELINFLAAQYDGGDEKLIALVDKATKPNVLDVWTPTAANFFSRVGGPYLNELWRDLLDLSETHPTATTFAKLKKGEKAQKLEKLFVSSELRDGHKVTNAQTKRIAAWLPNGMV